MSLVDRWISSPTIAADPLRRELVAVLTCPTGTTSAGYPYLERHAWERFRDWVPHLLADGARVRATVDALAGDVEQHGPSDEERRWVADGARVIRQAVNTAQITAPPDLWLLRHVLSGLARQGWLGRWQQGEVIEATDTAAPELELLLARGFLVRAGRRNRGGSPSGTDGYRWTELRSPRRVLEMAPLPADRPADLSWRWAAAFRGDTSHDALLTGVVGDPSSLTAPHPAPAWLPTPEDIELGYLLVPVVLGLRAADLIRPMLEAGRVTLERPVGAAATAVLRAAGVVDADGRIGPTGRRLLERGPGPFGIIEAYHPYLARIDTLITEGSAAVHVERGTNVAASQDANRHTFRKANDALDRFCEATGFHYGVFIEHAVGMGEATRQRWHRSGDRLTYVGADLEDAAIDATEAERERGRLPADMHLVRRADIGRPEIVVDYLAAHGIDGDGAVMLVGNGFHEIRDQSDAHLIDVFRGYHDAGIVLLFTEENALSTGDLLRTAWNTYHAGFRYVHERSGQGLRPATPVPSGQLGAPLRTSWTECATAAGYVRADAFCSRSRTIHPYTPPSGINPSISVNHLFVPGPLAASLGLA